MASSLGECLFCKKEIHESEVYFFRAESVAHLTCNAKNPSKDTITIQHLIAELNAAQERIKELEGELQLRGGGNHVSSLRKIRRREQTGI